MCFVHFKTFFPFEFISVYIGETDDQTRNKDGDIVTSSNSNSKENREEAR